MPFLHSGPLTSLQTRGLTLRECLERGPGAIVGAAIHGTAFGQAPAFPKGAIIRTSRGFGKTLTVFLPKLKAARARSGRCREASPDG
jgi:hypothetical protein